MNDAQKIYWDTISDDYQRLTTIATDDFHYGPLLPGDSELNILPAITSGTKCLELGCGGGQNSIYLAQQGADCTAIDISTAQIEYAAKLADDNQVGINLIAASLDDEDAWPQAKFDLVHSAFALPFVADPEKFIQLAAEHVAQGGCMVIATQHPVFAAEWLELEEDEAGFFLPSYFEPPDDIRVTTDGRIIGSSAYPVADVANWLHNAGMRDLRIWEPRPLPLERVEEAPYRSPAWVELHYKLSKAPIAIIYRTVKQ